MRRLASEPPLASPYLTASEAATYLRFKSARQLYKAISYGVTNKANARIPYVRRGRTLLFHRELLDRWLAGATTSELDRASKVQPGGLRTLMVAGAQR